ncbi:MAG TPA: glycosyltransferase [Pyrinomonadaceae bacterium]|jgi:glycosyltransferase involved in cell wall biosynthesis|nr:glycosyltransferase [Pyrinomonadaceae bacterium]
MTNDPASARPAPAPGEPFISVVVPARDAAAHLPRCLDALLNSHYPRFEIVVVDDASTDATADIARSRGCTVLRLAAQGGPAAARNRGARAARGDLLLFVDADVEVRGDTVARAAAHFVTPGDAATNAGGSKTVAGEGVAAVFGSYDDAPAETNFASQFKNLFHHYTHQHSSRRASTFWAGCGAVRRDAFDAVGGFDARRYARPSVEDIELGYRLRRAGFPVALDPELQAKHLKRWTLVSLVRADVRDRAVPWSRLILEGEGVADELNLRVAGRVSAALVLLAAALLAAAALTLAASLFAPAAAAHAAWLLAAAAAPLAAVVLINRGLYQYFYRLRGARFAAASCAMHLFYFLYGGVTFALCSSAHVLRRVRGSRRASLAAQVKDIRRAG